MAKMAQKSFKLPDEWSRELTRRVGQRMAETGEECSFATLLKEALDGHFNLSEATGIDSDGSSVPEPARANTVAKEA